LGRCILRGALLNGRLTDAVLIVVRPGVEVKPIEGNAAIAYRDLGEKRAHLGVEAVAVHAEIRRRVAVSDETRQNGHGCCRFHHAQLDALGPSVAATRIGVLRRRLR